MTTAPVTTTVELNVGGMTCASCAARIEKKLNRMGGVTASVNFATEKARVTFDPEVASLTDLRAAIENGGYGVDATTATIRIGSMTCASCVARNEKALSKVPGVLSVAVNLATEKATVEYLPGSILSCATSSSLCS